MFLEYIDNLYREACRTFDIPKEPLVPFNWFVPIKLQNWDVRSSFLISKQEKSKLLILNGRQRVYLSDIQIVETILRMGKNDREWFLSQFVKAYKGEFTPFIFKIESETFEGKGICRYPQEKTIKLFSDSSIDINDFVFLINFVVYKDICWSEKIEDPDFYQRTLCKYIALTDFYSLNQQRIKPFLKSIGYPMGCKKPIDRVGNNAIFDRIKTFDISLYG